MIAVLCYKGITQCSGVLNPYCSIEYFPMYVLLLCQYQLTSVIQSTSCCLWKHAFMLISVVYLYYYWNTIDSALTHVKLHDVRSGEIMLMCPLLPTLEVSCWTIGQHDVGMGWVVNKTRLLLTNYAMIAIYIDIYIYKYEWFLIFIITILREKNWYCLYICLFFIELVV